jgi:prophage regulatory protein
MSTQLYRIREVEARTGLHRVTIWRHVRRGIFPQPVSVGPRVKAWREEDLDRWAQSLPVRGAA